MSSPWIASLPMYDFPELADAHDRLWDAVRARLEEAGIADLPSRLSRDLHHEALWTNPRLILGQACEYPLAKRFGRHVRLVATPRYQVPGCQDATYRSAVLIRQEDPARSLADLRGRRCVINESLSNSGMNLLRAALAPLAGGARFFESVAASGSHRQSVEAVAAGQADVCAIDCVTLAHLRQARLPDLTALRVLDWTAATPSLPYVTAASVSDLTLQALRATLEGVSRDPALVDVRQALCLTGFDLAPDGDYADVLRLEQDAVRHGYSRLH